MCEKLKSVLYAAASVINICPSTNYLDLVAKESDQDAIRGDIYRVSEDMKAVLNYQIEINIKDY